MKLKGKEGRSQENKKFYEVNDVPSMGSRINAVVKIKSAMGKKLKRIRRKKEKKIGGCAKVWRNICTRFRTFKENYHIGIKSIGVTYKREISLKKKLSYSKNPLIWKFILQLSKLVRANFP